MPASAAAPWIVSRRSSGWPSENARRRSARSSVSARSGSWIRAPTYARHACIVAASRSGGSVSIGIPYDVRSRFVLPATISRLSPRSSNDALVSVSTIIRRVTSMPSP
jgi:hypothetical protein